MSIQQINIYKSNFDPSSKWYMYYISNRKINVHIIKFYVNKLYLSMSLLNFQLDFQRLLLFNNLISKEYFDNLLKG